MEKEARKNLKKLFKKIEKLKGHIKKAELRPCRSDAELRQKDEYIQGLKREMYDLEKEGNQLSMSYLNRRGEIH
jgi:mRNA-degrading endonuclease RelE of RelBE toxin-antitoxin system